MKNILISTLPLILVGHAAFAEDEKKLSTDIELGLVTTTGNTETNSIKAKVDVKQELEAFRNHLVLSGFSKQNSVTIVEDGESRSEDRTTAEKYFASLQTDFKLNADHRGLFAYASYEEDKFSAFEYQGTVALGYTDRVFKYDNSHLNYSVGPGVAFNQRVDTIENGVVVEEGESESIGVVRIALDFLYQINENAKFTQTFSSDAAFSQDDNTKSHAETALTANVMTGLALKASYVIDYNSRVSDDRKHADTTTSITFVLNF